MRLMMAGRLAIAVVALVACASCTRTEPAKRWSLDEIRSEFSKVPAPDTARSGELATVKKYGITSVSARYAASESGDDIVTHYRHALVGAGWTYLGDIYRGDHFGESYCKNKLLASVEILSGDRPSACAYSFSISWGEISENRCP